LPRRIPFSLAEITRFHREGHGAWEEGIEGGDGTTTRLVCLVYLVGFIASFIEPKKPEKPTR
jgi:hypothetical protein